MPLLDLTPDELLSTTRAVRKRLDFERPVEREAARRVPRPRPAGAERVQLRAVALRRRDRAETKAQLAECYRTGWSAYRKAIEERRAALPPTLPC